MERLAEMLHPLFARSAAVAMDGTTYNWLMHSDQMNLLNDYEWFISLQQGGDIESARGIFLEKAAYYLALNDYEGENSLLYGSYACISCRLIESLSSLDIISFDPYKRLFSPS